MKITEQQEKNLKHLIEHETCNALEVKDKIKNIFPELFKSKVEFKVDKYYTYYNYGAKFIFKVTALEHPKSDDKGGYGYGLDLSDEEATFDKDVLWCDFEDEVEEITKEEFLEHIKTYAEELGFKEGVTCYWENEDVTHYDLEGDFNLSTDYEDGGEYLCIGGKIIYQDGEFAKIMEEDSLDFSEVTRSTFWEKTMDLRWKSRMIPIGNQYAGTTIKVLQQKSVEVNTREEKWNDV